MFRARLLTTLILVPLVLFAIYYAYAWALALVVLSGVLLAGWEWTQLVPLKRRELRWVGLLCLLIAIWLTLRLFNLALMINLVVWGFIVVAVLTFPASQRVWGYRAIVGLLGLFLLPLFALSLAATFQTPNGKNLIVYLFCLVWAADIGAYLVGKGFGRYKLIPKVSPGKTYEGVLGGLVCALLIALGGYFFFHPLSAWHWFVTAAVILVISIVGDLWISVLKRRCHLKDTGQLIPGHGGILDRLDSLIAATPIFYFCLQYLPAGI